MVIYYFKVDKCNIFSYLYLDAIMPQNVIGFKMSIVIVVRLNAVPFVRSFRLGLCVHIICFSLL